MTDPAGVGALAGLRVLELGQLIAGPFAGMMLAGFGAEVIKVEPPGEGDPLRKWRKLHAGTSLWWRSLARNKRSVVIDLREPEGRGLIRRLIETRTIDVLIENFRPGRMEAWGLGWAELHAIDPRLVMVRISGFGQTGPKAQSPGFANVAEAVGGLRYLTGDPDRPPVRSGISLGDSLAGMHAAFGTLAALRSRDATGLGQVVDIALTESVFAMLESLLPEYDFFGLVRQRTGSKLEGVVPTATYPCRPSAAGEEQWIAIGANSDTMFHRLMLVIGRLDLADDPALRGNEGRVANVDAIDDAIAAWTSTRTVAEALAHLADAEVAAGPIQSIADIAADPQFIARDMFETVTLPDGRPLRIPAMVPRLSTTPGRTESIGPELGADTDRVLSELIGCTPSELDRLANSKVIARGSV